jgi:hypothetical protein
MPLQYTLARPVFYYNKRQRVSTLKAVCFGKMKNIIVRQCFVILGIYTEESLHVIKKLAPTSTD